MYPVSIAPLQQVSGVLVRGLVLGQVHSFCLHATPKPAVHASSLTRAAVPDAYHQQLPGVVGIVLNVLIRVLQGRPAIRKAIIACPATLVGNWAKEVRQTLSLTDRVMDRPGSCVPGSRLRLHYRMFGHVGLGRLFSTLLSRLTGHSPRIHRQCSAAALFKSQTLTPLPLPCRCASGWAPSACRRCCWRARPRRRTKPRWCRWVLNETKVG